MPRRPLFSNTSSKQKYTRSRSKRHFTLADVHPLLLEGHYRIGRHAHQHAQCEGFTENDIINVALDGQELMRYPEDARVLVLGYIEVSTRVRLPLHVVLEYSKLRLVDVVTAFIPEYPHRVISRTRLAQMLRYDRHVRMEKTSGPSQHNETNRYGAKKRVASSQVSSRWLEAH